MTASAVKHSSDNFSHHRGGAKRRNLRTDRDGDLVMDGSKRDRVGKTAGPGRGRGYSINTAAFQREVLKHVASDSNQGGSIRATMPRPISQGHLVELKVTGWTNSKASTQEDRGVSSLIGFLERHASKRGSLFSQKGRNPAHTAHIKKSRVEGDVLSIYVPTEEVSAYAKVDGFVFAGKNIKIEGASIRAKSPQNRQTSPEPANDVKELFQDFLSSRYNPDTKVLDLSSLGTDAKLNSVGMFNTTSTQSKFFPALMKICDAQFKTAQEKKETIQSISLAGNEIANIAAVTTLAQTFPDLQNLDLSGNKFDNLNCLIGWKNKFRFLDHLVLTNNPLEQLQPGWETEILQWYPRLRLLNGIQVRTEEEVAQKNKLKKAPLPILGPNFQDEAQIAETFITTFFAGFDTDRSALVNMYYDTDSNFSLNVNTHAMRDPTQQGGYKTQGWDAYIRLSRNLKHLNNPGPRAARKFQGPDDIRKIWTQLPATRHPNLITDQQKWSIDCQHQPGVPDPSGQCSTGVGGFLITVHGEYEELDAANSGPAKYRSFDRTFILGPGGPSGVKVVSDLWTIRAYGGFAAWKPEGGEQDSPENLVAEISRTTGMNMVYSRMCLEESGGDLRKALAAFETAKASLPQEAFT